MNIVDVQTVHDESLLVQRVTMDNGESIERIKKGCKVVGLCHDPVNDVVMLVKSYNFGSMMESTHFPYTVANDYQGSHEAVQSHIEESTGAIVKSVQYLLSYMEAPDYSYAPIQLFYVTFDSRSVLDNEEVVLTTGKSLYEQVTEGEYNDINVVYGSHYLKMLHFNLIK